MADQQQNYPDSNGARWEGPARPTPQDRPAFLDRTEPMSRQERDARGGDVYLEGMPASRDHTSRLPSHERGDIDPTNSYPAQRPAEPAAPQWSPDNVPVPPPAVGEPATGDPELAAVSGMDGQTGSFRPAPPQPPHQQPPHQQPPQPQFPPQMPPEAAPPAAPQGPAYPDNAPQGDLNEPTQMHNPVSNPLGVQQRGHTYPAQVSDGVYQRNKSSFGAVMWIIAFVMVVPIAYMLVRHLGIDGPPDAGAVVSGTFALAGLPLTAYGVQASLSAGPPTEPAAWLRAPYMYLVVGLGLIVAAGI